ncbi:MAG: hypothetical protein EOS04_19945 [Mesorhizobium sp.]|nr:MAG: hypothetical protein EOR98_12615 [Mesorhizobium sp.]RWN77456.1 MAG: hypothetical protein EOS02_11880 [Mesorhizobium sp.]RWN80304.1 MAG: hypothetical protein EOS01_12680 [Mesorhizobium sp.]RWN86201.1 MAG: hypothetical protein EOS04_19945 [Mesorhizobium sp.]RWO15183.1 MAG: hypothetical protein EOS15_11655 [Mesorhizobium sp.]
MADVGHQVACVDVDRQKIENLNKKGAIFEQGLRRRARLRRAGCCSRRMRRGVLFRDAHLQCRRCPLSGSAWRGCGPHKRESGYARSRQDRPSHVSSNGQQSARLRSDLPCCSVVSVSHCRR